MEIKLNYSLIGMRLRECRKNKHLTQERIAELTELSAQHISGIERGSAQVSLPALVRLCNVLDVTPDEILMDSLKSVTPALLQSVEKVFIDASADEVFLMLSQAENLKQALREKHLLDLKDR